MREILFRGKRKETGEWVEGMPCPDFKGGVGAIQAIFSGYIYDVIPETVGQFTGLTDKNGKKIFEGDIIKSCEYDDIYYVKYCAEDYYPAFDVVPEINLECNGLSHLHIVEGVEVIGNIHDNPELLKGGEGDG